MSDTSFYYKNKRYTLERTEWAKKAGANCKNANCPLRNKTTQNCESTLLSHCCKHVINGTDLEKEKYRQAATHYCGNASISDELSDPEDVTVKNYERLSREVINNPGAICLEGARDQFRISCEGSGEMEGFYDFLQIQSDEYLRNPNIVSCYYGMSRPEDYSMLRLIRQKYLEKKKYVEGVCCVPTIKEEYGKDKVVIIPNADIVFATAHQMLKEGEVNNKDIAQSAAAWFLYHNLKCEIERYWFLNELGAYKDYWGDEELTRLFEDDDAAFHNAIKDDRNQIAMRLQSCIIMTVIRGKYKKDLIPENISFYKREWIDEYLYPDNSQKKMIMLLLLHHAQQADHVLYEHYTRMMNPILEEIRENEKMNNGIGSVADYSAYKLVSDHVNAILTARELKRIFTSLNPQKDKNVEQLQIQIRQTIQGIIKKYKQLQTTINKTDPKENLLVRDWIKFFNELYGMDFVANRLKWI